MPTFPITDEALDHLRSRDPLMGKVIDRLGVVSREISTDLFAELCRSIVGQQISTKAQVTICGRIRDGLGGEITPEGILALSREELQQFGISFRKVDYIQNIAQKVVEGSLDLEALHRQSDAQVCRSLSALSGIGVWTAEMLMTFSMARPDVLSYGDLAIHRGMRMLYHHRRITPQLFEKYRRRYSPYGSTASLYLWAIAGGAVPGMRDYAPKKKPAKKQSSGA